MVKFGDESQVTCGEICIDPLINARAHFRTEMILPVASFPFPDEVAVGIHETSVFRRLVIDEFVRSEIVETQV